MLLEQQISPIFFTPSSPPGGSITALNTHEATGLARDTIVTMWGLQDRSEDVITPKYLTVSVGYSVMPLDVKYETSSLICGSSYSVERGLAL